MQFNTIYLLKKLKKNSNRDWFNKYLFHFQTFLFSESKEEEEEEEVESGWK
jgi:hypothetical protein